MTPQQHARLAACLFMLGLVAAAAGMVAGIAYFSAHFLTVATR
jgi:hypothetical protein